MEILQPLRARELEIQRRWEILLRVEPVTGPLANPDALVHLIPASLGAIWSALERGEETETSIAQARLAHLPTCECGNNPYLAYFTAAEQTVVEALILVQAELPAELRSEAAVAEVIATLKRMARAEIEAFCGLCLHRCQVGNCRHLAAS